MLDLGSLKNTHRPKKKVKRVGRGLGSGLGKTSGRGEKGAGARAGYKRRYSYEGGQFRLFMKLPCRGFSNARFRNPVCVVNLHQIEAVFQDGEVVNRESLKNRGFIKGRDVPIKLLGKGELTKKVKIEVDALSDSAREKLTKAKIHFSESKKA